MAEGRYRITALPSGTYGVSFSAIGYRPEIRGVTLGASDFTLDVTMVESVMELIPLQVRASPAATSPLTSPQPVSILAGDQLEMALRTSLGAQLEGQPGFRNYSTGAGIGKPVIRGLRRVPA
jgi:iron complex outermembrane receptor protein